MSKIAKTLGLLALLFAPIAQAGMLQFNFSGTMTHLLLTGQETTQSAFSGSILIDSSVPDSLPQADKARYRESVLGGSVQWDGVDYNALQPLSQIDVLNDNSAFDDLISFIFTIQAADGSSFLFGLQLADFTRSIFSNDSLPSSFELGQFSDFDPSDANSTFGVVLGPNVFGAFDSAELIAVPNAGTIWLTALGAVMLLGYRTRRSAAS